MAEEILKLEIDLDLDIASYLAGVSRATGAAQKIGKGLKDTGKKGTLALKGVGEAAKKVLLPALIKGHLISQSLAAIFRTMTAGVHAFTAAVSPLPTVLAEIGESFNAKSFMDSSSSFEEQLSKFKVVFGEFRDDALGFAHDFGAAVGRSQVDIVSAMATFQDTFVPLGFAREQATELSKGLTQLGVDIASFNEAADPDVFNRLTSALVGNHNAVRRFGIQINRQAIEMELAARGITTAFTDLDAPTKTLARLAIIFRSTADATGDAERTQSSFANSMKRMTSVVDDLKVKMGKELTEAVLKTIEEMGGVGEILPVLEMIGGAIAIVSKAMMKFGVTAFKAMKDFIRESGGSEVMLLRLQKGLINVKSVMQTVGVVIANMFDTMKITWMGFKAGLVVIADVISVILLGIRSAWNSMLKVLQNSMAKFLKKVGRALPDWFSDTKKYLKESARTWKDWSRKSGAAAKDFGEQAEHVQKEGVANAVKSGAEMQVVMDGMMDRGHLLQDSYAENAAELTGLSTQIALATSNFEAMARGEIKAEEATEELTNTSVDLKTVIDDLFESMKKSKELTDLGANSNQGLARSMFEVGGAARAEGQALGYATSQLYQYITASENARRAQQARGARNFDADNNPFAFNFDSNENQAGGNFNGVTGTLSGLPSPTSQLSPGQTTAPGRAVSAPSLPGLSFATGGVFNGPAGIDQAVARVSRGEHIMPPKQTAATLPLLESIRRNPRKAMQNMRGDGSQGGHTTNMYNTFNVSSTGTAREIETKLARLRRQGSRQGTM